MLKKKHERKAPHATDYVRRRRWIRTRRRVSSIKGGSQDAPTTEIARAESVEPADESLAGDATTDDGCGIFGSRETVGILSSSYQDPEPLDLNSVADQKKEPEVSAKPASIDVQSNLSCTALEVFPSTMDKSAVDSAWTAAAATATSLHDDAKSRAALRMKRWKVKKGKIHRQINLLEKTIASMEAVAAEEQKRRRSSVSAHSSPHRSSIFNSSKAKTPLSPDSREFANGTRSSSNSTTGTINLAPKMRCARAKLDALKRLYWHPREKNYTLRFSVDGIFYGLRDFSVESFTSSFSIQMNHQTNGALGITPTCKVIMKGHTVCCGKHVKVVGEKGTRVPKSIWDAMYLDTDFEATIYLIFVEDPDDPKALHRGRWEFLFNPEATKVELNNFSRRVKGGVDLPEPIVRKLCSDVMCSLVRDLALLYFPNEAAIAFEAPPAKLDIQGAIEIRGPRIDEVMENALEEIDVEKEMRRPDSNESKGILGAAAAQLLSLVTSEKRMKEIARLLNLSFGQFNLLVALKDDVAFPSGHNFNTVTAICDYYSAFLSPESSDYNEEQANKLRDTWKRFVELAFIRKQQSSGSSRFPFTFSGNSDADMSATALPPQFELFNVDEFFETIGRLAHKPASIEVRVSHFHCTVNVASVVEALAKAYERIILGIDYGKPRTGYDNFLYGFRFGRKGPPHAAGASAGGIASPGSATSPLSSPRSVDPLLFMQTDPSFRSRFKTFSKIVRTLKSGVEFIKRNIDEVSAEVTGSMKGMGDDCQVSGSFRDMDYQGPVNASIPIPPMFLGLYRAAFIELGGDRVGLQIDLMLPTVATPKLRVKTLAPFGRIMISELHTEVLLDIDAIVEQHRQRSLSAASEKTAPWSPSSSFTRQVESEKTNELHSAFSLSFGTIASEDDDLGESASGFRSSSSSFMLGLLGATGMTALGKLQLSSSQFTKLHANAKTGSFKTRLLPILQQVLSRLVRPLIARSFPQHQTLFDSIVGSMLNRVCSSTLEMEFELLVKAFVMGKQRLMVTTCGAPMHPTPLAFRDELPLLDVILQLDELVNMWIDDRYPPYANPMYF